MSPEKEYQRQIKQYGYQADPAQASAIAGLDALYQRLTGQKKQPIGFIKTLGINLGLLSRPLIPGCYLWGDVGRGKTWLMDLFFENLPIAEKYRIHFHQFMLMVTDELETLKGQQNPLKLVSRNFSRRFRVLCLDEFQVTDITHAMLLHGLLDAMYKEGITLVVTSNRAPDELYKNGLQRDRFLPAIELIKQNSDIIQLAGEIDHRLRLLEKTDTWYQPIDENSEHRLMQRFLELAPCTVTESDLLYINHRDIASVCHADDVVWFDFYVICTTPRASADYLELAQIFSTIFISNIAVMDETRDDMARRFINLIDALYDRKVKLIATAEAEPAELYKGMQLRFPFKRTVSRLIEMRSHEYLAKPHQT